MHLLQFFRVIFISALLCSTRSSPLNSQDSTLKDSRHGLQTRILEETMLGRWHLMFEDLLELFLPPPQNIAFWGFGVFLQTIRSRIASDFMHRPPSPHYTLTMGLLQLCAESTANDPIDWEAMDWLVGRLQTFWQGGWHFGEVDALLTDLWSQSQIHVTLRVLLDRPLSGQGVV